MKKKIVSLSLLFLTYLLTYIIDKYSKNDNPSKGFFLLLFIIPLGIGQYILLFCYLIREKKLFLILQFLIFLFFFWIFCKEFFFA